MVAATKKIETGGQPGYRAVLDVDKLDDSPHNPRKSFDDTKLAELAESMKAIGQLQSILVRPSTVKGRFELAAGHRRKRAAELAGIPALDAVVRELTDAEMIIVGLTENGDREGLPPLDEANAYQALRAEGLAVDEIADKTGKSKAHVERRLRLTHLCPEAQDAVREGWLAPTAATSLCRLESFADQADVIGNFIHRKTGDDEDETGTPEPVTAKEIEYRVEEKMRVLADAPFPLDDADLVPLAGACTKCPKRSAAQPALFGASVKEDRCTDGACFERKLIAIRTRKVDEAKERGLNVVTDLDKYFHAGGSLKSKWIDLDGTCYQHPDNKTWRELLPKGTRPAVVVVDAHGNTLELMDAGEAETLAGFDDAPKKPTPAPAPAPKAASPTGGIVEPARGVFRTLDEWKEDHAVVDAIVKLVERKTDGTPRALWELIADYLEQDSRRVADRAQVSERRGAPDSDFSEIVITAKRGCDLAGVVVEVLLPTNPFDLDVYASAIGVDAKAVRARANPKKKATSAVKKPAPKKAAKKAKAKKKGGKR